MQSSETERTRMLHDTPTGYSDGADCEGTSIRAVQRDEVTVEPEALSPSQTSDAGSGTPRELATVFELLEKSAGVNFSEYKPETMLRGIHRRVAETGSSTLSAYLDYLGLHPAEIGTLAQKLMLRVTGFFRDADAFESLERLLPALLAECSAGSPLRVWCPACSTGEEAYSIAMLIREVCQEQDISTKLKLFATDIDAHAIERAGQGTYPVTLGEHLSASRIERFFDASSSGFRIKRELRQEIVFTVHNALSDAPFSRIDLLCCRNLLIYLQPSAQRNLLARCARGLRPGGLLVLGANESAAELSDALEPVDVRAKIFRRSASRSPQETRESVVSSGSSSGLRANAQAQEQRRLIETVYRLLSEEHGSACFVLSTQGMLVHSIGNVSEYIQLRVGPTSLDVIKLARGGLGRVIAAGMSRALRTGLAAEYRGVPYRDLELASLVDVRVLAFSTSQHSRYFLVTLRPHHVSTKSGSDADQLEEVQTDLERTRRSLQTAIEEVELSNEELLATNEELLTANEELRASNDVLQANNEQLLTIDAENQQRIRDLARSNSDTDNLLSSAQLGILFLDSELNLRRFTPDAAVLLNLVERDLGRPVAHVVSALGGIDLVGAAKSVLRAGQSRDLQVDLEARHFLVHLVPYSTKGVVDGVIISFVDVSELRDAKDDLEAVMNSLPEHVAVLDAGGVIRVVNDAWRDFAFTNGFIGGSGEGTNYLEVTERAAGAGDIYANAALDGLRRVLAGESKELRLEYPWSSASEERAFLMQARPLLHGQGAVVSHVDITDRMRKERSIRETEALFRKLFAFSREPLLLIDVDTLLVVEASTTTAELFQCTSSRLLGASIAELLIPEDCTWAELVDSIDGAGSGGAVVEFMLAEPTSKETCTLRTRLIPMQSGSKRCLLLAPNERAQSIHPSVASSAELDQSQKMEGLGKLAGGVAHELNNLLAAILSVAFAWRADLPPNSQQASDVDAILAACRRGGDLTRSLLGFARRGNGIREEVDLAVVVKDVIALMRATAGPGISFEEELDAEAVWTMGDRSQIGQVLMNLCVNALDAMKERGTLHVCVSAAHLSGKGSGHDGSFVRLQVRDDGPGMDDATRERAFEPFFTTKLRGEGTGLGLAMVYGVTRAHGGWAELRSAPGQGTTATVFFPQLMHASPNAPGPATIPAAAPGAQILVVDDDILVRNALRRSMGRLGYGVFTACDGEDALSQVQTVGTVIDAVLLDLRMPGKDGLAVLAELRESFPELPVILCSGYTDFEGSPLFDLDELTDFLQKPVDPQVLLERIQRLVRIRDGSQPSGRYVRAAAITTDIEQLRATS